MKSQFEIFFQVFEIHFSKNLNSINLTIKKYFHIILIF